MKSKKKNHYITISSRLIEVEAWDKKGWEKRTHLCSGLFGGSWTLHFLSENIFWRPMTNSSLEWCNIYFISFFKSSKRTSNHFSSSSLVNPDWVHILGLIRKVASSFARVLLELNWVFKASARELHKGWSSSDSINGVLFSFLFHFPFVLWLSRLHQPSPSAIKVSY